MTKQQIVNRVYDVFILQGNKASKKPAGCFYGNPDEGPGCAVACLMSRKTRDKLFAKESLKQKSFTVAFGLEKGIIPKSFERHIDLLRDLQLWHDRADYKTKRLNTKTHIKDFKDICAEYNLQYPGGM